MSDRADEVAREGACWHVAAGVTRPCLACTAAAFRTFAEEAVELLRSAAEADLAMRVEIATKEARRAERAEIMNYILSFPCICKDHRQGHDPRCYKGIGDAIRARKETR